MVHVRKKPLIVEAVQVVGITKGSFDSVEYDIVVAGPHLEWFGEALKKDDGDEGAVYAVTFEDLIVNTQHGPAMMKVTDWVFRGVDGEVYPVTNAVFEKTYDIVSDEEAATTTDGGLTTPAT